MYAKIKWIDLSIVFIAIIVLIYCVGCQSQRIQELNKDEAQVTAAFEKGSAAVQGQFTFFRHCQGGWTDYFEVVEYQKVSPNYYIIKDNEGKEIQLINGEFTIIEGFVSYDKLSKFGFEGLVK